MIQIISGVKGKGKTKFLIQKANEAVKAANGSVVYLDKNNKHMYELSNKVRLIKVMDYSISNCDEFIGFICGIISQDHDLQQMYFDSFLKIAKLEDWSLSVVVEKLEKLSEQFGVDFVLSVSCDEKELDDSLKSKIIVSL